MTGKEEPLPPRISSTGIAGTETLLPADAGLAQAAEAIPLLDQPARDLALETSRSLLVQAPAGSGKTELLTLRFLHLLAVVKEPEEILAITFTRAATAEMRARVIQALEQAQQRSGENDESPGRLDARARAARAALDNDAAREWKLLEQPQRLNIQTIDSLCLTIAQGTPLLSRLGGSLTPTEDAESLYALAARRALAHLGGGVSELSAAIRSLLELRETSLSDCERLIAGMLGRRDQWGHVLPLLPGPDRERPDWHAVRTRLEAPFQRERQRVIGAAHAFFRGRTHDLHELLYLAATACENLESAGREPRWNILSEIRGLEQFAEHRQWECLCEFLLTKQNGWRKRVTAEHGFPGGTAGRATKDRFRRLVEGFSEDPDLLDILCQLRSLPPEGYSPQQWLLLEHILVILRYAAAELRVVFAERGVVDFVELALAAREVLRDEEGEASEVAADMALRWPHLLVDEFQDTSRAHYEVLTLLAGGRDAAGTGTFFLVGDPMQSIYGFREAEVELFEATRRHGLGRGAAAQPLEFLELQMNFRSHAGLVDRLNEVFAEVFSGGRAGSGYHVAFTPSVARRPAPGGAAKSVHVAAQCIPSAAGAGEKIAARRAEAAMVVRIIQQHSPEMESAKQEDRPFRIAVLVRAKQHLQEIVRQLRESAIPFRAVEIEELSKRQEVLDVKALACALMHPMDRIAWLSVLRAPWCGLTLRDLHILCGNDDRAMAKRPLFELLRTRASLLSRDGEQRASRVWAALEVAMREKHRQISFSRWVERLWWTLGGRECVDPSGYENVRAFFQMLEQLPPYGSQLDQQLKRVFAQPDPRASERNGVQLMTIHKAKGLEFEVVIVPGLENRTAGDDQALLCWLERTTLGEPQEPELLIAPIGRKGAETDPLYRWISRQKEQREAEEAKRLLYVAATRASRELHLMGTATTRTRADGASVVEPGSSRSLLATAWGALGDSFAAAGNTPAAPAGAGAEEAPQALRLRRLRPGWRSAMDNDTSTVTITASPSPPEGMRKADLALQAGRFPRLAAALGTRAAGVVVHALFEEITLRASGNLEDLRREIGGWRPRAVAMLRHRGLGKAEAEERSRKVIQALQSALEDDIGRWILAAQTESETESSWSSWDGSDEAEAGMQTMRADRIFRAGAEPGSSGETHLWIVDYKTAQHDGGELEAFLESEKEKYRSQLEGYAAVLRKAHGEKIELRVALYYPLLKRLQWWPA